MRAALLATAALAFAPLAHAQSVNNQYQLRGSTAVTTIGVGTTHDAGATAVASGNAVTLVNEDYDTATVSTQHMDGDANATANATVWNASGAVAITSAAVSNGGTATTENGDVDVTASQLAHGDANVTTNFIGGYAGDAGTSASASNNVAAVSAVNGGARLILDQEGTGSVSATVDADHDFVAGQAVSGSIAGANNLTMGGDTATILNDTRQSATGENVSARTDLYVGSAADVSGNATANANAVTIDNQWGYVNARVAQEATANVTAGSYVTLGSDFTGFASAGAYGVGNQTMVSNVGSDTVLDVTQNNTGDVAANAAMNGEGDGMALASSAAYGNNVTGALCSQCDESGVPSLTASSSQTNDGNVYSSASVNSARAQTVGATATAIGNAATYSATRPN
jgi:hypothetical protein